MISVYRAANLQEAELFRHRLADQGIKSEIRGQFLQGALGELPMNTLPEVCVHRQADYRSARELVAQMEAELREPARPDWTCSRCKEESPGNFETCWNCGADSQA